MLRLKLVLASLADVVDLIVHCTSTPKLTTVFILKSCNTDIFAITCVMDPTSISLFLLCQATVLPQVQPAQWHEHPIR
jgi:hypothetical protein